MRMSAAVLYEQGLPAPYADSQPLQIEEVELEGPGEDRVLVEVCSAGLCHSDLSQVAGQRKRMLPVVMGHEGAGIVREVGSRVTTFKPGDPVLMTVGSGCGACDHCVNSRPVLCDLVGASRAKGVLTNGTSRLPVERLMSGTFGFDELNLNLDRLEHGEVLRQILRPHG